MSLAAAPLAAQDGAAARPLAPTDLGGVIVSVSSPAGDPQVDADTRRLLEARMGAALAGAGIVGVGSSTPFVSYPLVSVVDEGTSDVGLRAQTVVALEVTFVVRHVESRSVIHQWTGRVAGTGSTRPAAIRQAVASLSPSDPTLHEFGTETRRRIVDYYERSCDLIRSRARATAAAGRLTEGLAELAAVPVDASACQARAARDAAALAGARVSPNPERRTASSPGRRRGMPLTDEVRRAAAAHFNNSTSKLVRFDYAPP